MRVRAKGLRARRGITVLELIVALLVGTIAIAGARAVASAVHDLGTRLDAVHRETSSAFEGERTWRRLVLASEAGRDRDATFAGDARFARFDSWCAVPGGWGERCVVTGMLSLTPSGDSLHLILSSSTGDLLTLGQFPGPGKFLYLDDAAHGGAWIGEWAHGPTAPVAVAIASATDTIIAPTRRHP